MRCQTSIFRITERLPSLLVVLMGHFLFCQTLTIKGLDTMVGKDLDTTLDLRNTVKSDEIIQDESGAKETIEQIIKIDSVWAGHPVNFCLYAHENRQYIAYYNVQRNIVVGQRTLDEDQFQLYGLPPTSRATHKGTSTVLNWDSHNYLTLAVDKKGFIHFSGNVHNNPLTYFRSTKPNDITSLEQIYEMVGTEESRTTYPHFMLTNTKELLYHYRNGGSGNGNEIYNIYNTETGTWSRLLETPLTDGQGLMNAYQSEPTLKKDGWHHLYWVWRDTPDCSTNHDLSYMKSPDLKNWFSAFDEPIKLPATFDQKALIVDPIPIKGGIINLAAKMILDVNNRPVFVYHKYDDQGNLQFYSAKIRDHQWQYNQITNWDYRWAFEGNGSIGKEVILKDLSQRQDGNYEVDYWHIKYGNGTILLNDEFKSIGKVLKPEPLSAGLHVEGLFPGLLIKTVDDSGHGVEGKTRYVLKWETLFQNRDQPRPKPWPKPSQLYLYKLKTK